MEGWIKLHRKIQEWQWFHSANHLKLWNVLLLRANHKETTHRLEVIKPGQLLTGRTQLAQWSNFSEQQVRTMLQDFKRTSEITIKSTKKYSLITILNWHEYQPSNQENNQQITNNQPTDNQQITTSKNENNNKNEKNEENIILKPSPLSALFHHRPDIQKWLNLGNHDTHAIIVRDRSHHEIAELIPKAYEWALPKGKRAEQFLLTFFNNKNTHGYGANQAKKAFSRRGHGVIPSPENPTGDPYLQQAIDEGLVG